MLTDAFFRRYEDVTLFPSFTERERRFLGQASQIITDDLFPRNKTRYKEEKDDPSYKGQEVAHNKLARELGLDYLIAPTFLHSWTAPNGNKMSQTFPRLMENRTKQYLTAPISETASPELFVKFRVSLVELCFQSRAAQLDSRRTTLQYQLGHSASDMNAAIQLYNALQPLGVSWQSKEKREIESGQVAFDAAVHELNERFRQARIPLSYHNNLIQVSDDALLATTLERPFWSLVAGAKWASVDQLMKEAIDRRDRGERDSVTPAMQALESVIKIISGEKGWNNGQERGAAHYINNLVKEREGVRFIAVWEKDALFKLFDDIRNHFGHGPGAAPVPTLRSEQTDWAIDAAMGWIKSLVRRV